MKKIFIVDDAEEMLEGVRIALEDEGFEVYATSDNLNVCEKVKEIRPSLILLDYWMPGIDGSQIAKELKEEPKTSSIPVILITANQNVEQIAKDIGADDYISKPFDLDYLISKINNNLS